jgi:hypothetical protein
MDLEEEISEEVYPLNRWKVTSGLRGRVATSSSGHPQD